MTKLDIKKHLKDKYEKNMSIDQIIKSRYINIDDNAGA